jgi:2-dehydropantoate 2-reductase
MRIVVIGAGALGAYFGARLAEIGADVTFLVRERRAKQIQEQGIHVNSTQGDFTIKNPKVITSTTEVKSVDLVFISVKGYHLQGTIDNLKQLTEKGAYVLPILNGIEHVSMLQEQLGYDRVIGGLSFIMATLDDNGHVVHSSDFHNLVFGPLDPAQTNICKQLEALAEKANISVDLTDKILYELWKKYMFINAFSGITTATNLPIGPIRDYQETFHIAEMILLEMKQLANEYNVAITKSDVDSAKKSLLNLNQDATSSMHQDRRKQQTLEVNHLHGGAIRLAEAVGLKLPFTVAVYGLIKPFERV